MTGSSIAMSTFSATIATDAVFAMDVPIQEPMDIRRAPTSRSHERAYWRGLMTDHEPERLSRAVLERLELRPDGRVLAIHQDEQDDIEGYFRRIARARLSRMPMCQRSFDLAVGHPVELARLAFEQREDPLPAAAMYALSHDDLFPVRDVADCTEWSGVRFALARCLARLPMPEGQPKGCVALAEAALRHLEDAPEGGTPQPELKDAIESWLSEHRE